MKTSFVITALYRYINQSAHEPSFWEAFFFPFVGTMLISLLVYCLPVLSYRAVSRDNKPIENIWKAAGVAWIFWICSFIVIVLYHLIAGHYEIDGFSVRPGIPDFLCLLLSWFILHHGKGKDARSAARTCAYCRANLPKNTKFCPKCGTKVPPLVPQGKIICPGCQKTVPLGNYCPECGHKFLTAPTHKPEPPKQNARSYSPPPTNNLDQKMKSQYTEEEMRRIKEEEMRRIKAVEKNDLFFAWGTLIVGVLLILLVLFFFSQS